MRDDTGWLKLKAILGIVLIVLSAVAFADAWTLYSGQAEPFSRSGPRSYTPEQISGIAVKNSIAGLLMLGGGAILIVWCFIEDRGEGY